MSPIHTCGGVLIPDVLLHPTIAEDDEANDAEALPLMSLDFVKAHAPTIDKARDTVIQEMENMVMTGLADLVCERVETTLMVEPNFTCIITADGT